MVSGEKVYYGTCSTTVQAAVVYDMVNTQVNGLKARNNFNVTYVELISLLKMPDLIEFRQNSRSN